MSRRLTCAHCGKPLPPYRTGRPRQYCSSTCRLRAFYGRAAVPEPPTAPVLFAVEPLAADVEPAPDSPAQPWARGVPRPGPAPHSDSRLDSLLWLRDLLDWQLDRVDPDHAAPLHRQFRETLREIEELQLEQAELARATEASMRTGPRRIFNPGAF